jgi:hypothetical protein
MLNISHRQTTAYHPEANSAVERLHRHCKDALIVQQYVEIQNVELQNIQLQNINIQHVELLNVALQNVE